LFYAPLQGIRNFCDYLAIDAAASLAGAAATAGAVAGVTLQGTMLLTASGLAGAGSCTCVGVGLIPTIIYFLLD
jgi:hypothetical protein